MSSSASHQGCGEPKTKSRISDSTYFAVAPCKYSPPIFCSFIPPPSSFRETTERHDGLYSFISMLLQAGRPPALSSLFLKADTILPPGEKDRSCETAAMQCQIRESETRTYVEFCGLPQKSSSSGNGSDSDNNRERHIQQNTGANRRTGGGGTQLCGHPQGQRLKVKPDM